MGSRAPSLPPFSPLQWVAPQDVDGFHPLNIGALAMRGRDPVFVPCTPKGCLELLKRSGVQMAGKRAAVVGRSNIVGMPAALLLQREDATVTVIHSRTPDAQKICAEVGSRGRSPRAACWGAKAWGFRRGGLPMGRPQLGGGAAWAGHVAIAQLEPNAAQRQ